MNGSARIQGPTERRVLIVDDHPIVRQGLRQMIDLEPDLKVCGEAQSEREARVAIRELEPDVVIVDISSPRATAWSSCAMCTPTIRVCRCSCCPCTTS